MTNPPANEERGLQLARALCRACDEKRVTEILLLDLRGICGYTDFFVIATVTSMPQTKGVVREAKEIMRAAGCKLLSEHGLGSGHWVLLDYGDVVLHIFDRETRYFYQLEELWGDAEPLPWTD